MDPIWSLRVGQGPIIATAIHDGHDLRPDIASIMALSDEDRLREEDPFTRGWTSVVSTRVVGTHSRFQVDLNRPRDKAVYRMPEDAWGLHVWSRAPSNDIVQASLAEYDGFYSAVKGLLEQVNSTYGPFVVFDLHTYNHRRGGPGAAPADPRENPQVNVGTGTMQRGRWAPIVDRFIADLSHFDFPGGTLDVRENVKFQGGQFSRWVHETFPDSGCCLAVEFKKFFMDEWTGEPDKTLVQAITDALRHATPGVLAELKHL
jgi:hypothetical protein